jgi:hypothetical protein
VWIVINKQGIVRYSTFQRYPNYPRPFELPIIQDTIDSLVTTPTDVDDRPALSSHRLSASPNPFRNETMIEMGHAGSGEKPARVTVHDLAGRRIATLWNGPLPAGATRVAWDGRASGGSMMPAGVYVIRADFGGTQLSRRVVRIR